MSGWEGFTTVIGTVLGSVAFPGVGTFVGGMIGRELGRDTPTPPPPGGGHSLTPDEFKKMYGLDAIPAGGAGQQDKGKAAEAAAASADETARALARLAELDAKTQATLKEIENAGEEGRKALDEIQKSIDDKMTELGPRMNTEEGRKEFREFIIEKLTKAKEVIAKNNQLAEEKAREAAELTKGYGDVGANGDGHKGPDSRQIGYGGPDGTGGGDSGGGKSGGGDASTAPASAPPAGTATATGMPFGSGMPFGGGMPMPSMPGMGGGGMPGIGDPLGGLSGLSGLGSGSDLPKVEDAASHSTDDKGSSLPGVTDPGTDNKGGDHKGGEPKVTDGTTEPASATGGADHGGVGTTDPAPTGAKAWSIDLPDNSTTTARNAIGAEVTKDVLSGTAVADAYSKKDITLPPVGTPIIDSVSPSMLKSGDVGMWKDHYVMALGDGKVWVSGQVQKLESLTSGPDFLGWFDPTAKSAGAGETSVK